MAHLVVQGDGGAGRYEISGEFVIGRDRDCSVVIDDARVSRHHARIVKEEGGYYLQDLKSLHGTYLNGRRIQERAPLAEKDLVQVCDRAFSFHLLPQPPGEPGEKELILSVLDATGAARPAVEARPEVKLQALLEIHRGLQNTLLLEDLLPKILDCLFCIFPLAERGFVLLVDPATRELIPKARRSRKEGGGESLRLSQTVLKRAVEGKQAVLSADARSDAKFESSRSVSVFDICSIMCAPMLGHDGTPLGVLQLHTEGSRGAFTEEDLAVLASVASNTAMALENARLHEDLVARERLWRELEIARDVQRRFLPARLPSLAGYRFHAYYEAARTVGGDYYGFVDLPGGRLAISVGDVSGKGMPAAMLMARLSSDVRYALLASPDAPAALRFINRSLSEAEIDDRFVTLLLMVLDPAEGLLTVANAGHPPPLLRRPGGGVEEVGKGKAGLPLNVSPDADYAGAAASVPLEPGAVVLAYTDGVTEAMDAAGGMFGRARLEERFRAAPRDAEGAGQAVVEEVLRFAAGRPLPDDLTLVSFGRESGR